MNKTDMPLVTIVTITFNLIKAKREKFFRQCLASVNEQTYGNIEHVIIDGASNDGTVDLIKEFVNKGWVKYLSEPDSGIYDAMNKGIRMANGKYIAFLNSDDFYSSKFGIEMSVKALEETGACFSYAPVINLDETSGNKQVCYPKISNIFLTIVPNHQTMLFSRDTLVKEGMFNTNFKCVGDYDLNLRLCLKKYKSVFVEEAFVTYRLGGYSLEATKSGLVFKEVSKIYYENYNKLCPITIAESERICGDIYSFRYEDVPLKLALKLKEFAPYFDYDEYSDHVTRKSFIKKILKLFYTY